MTKKKRGMATRVIVELILVIGFIVLFLVALITFRGCIFNQQAELQAKGTLSYALEILNDLDENPASIYFQAPAGWTVVSFKSDIKKNGNFVVPTAYTYKNVICICQKSCKTEFCAQIRKPILMNGQMFSYKIGNLGDSFLVKEEGEFYKIYEKEINVENQQTTVSEYFQNVQVDNTWKDIGDFSTTTYYSAYEGDYPLWKSSDSLTEQKGSYYCRLDQNKRMFYEEVLCEGSGLGITKKGVYSGETIKETKETSEVINNKPYNEIGITSIGTDTTAKRTVAIDMTIIPERSQIKIEFDCEGASDECKEICNEWSNSVYVAEDIGGSIKEKHIDIFAGLGKKEAEKINNCLGLSPGGRNEKVKLKIGPVVPLSILQEEDKKRVQLIGGLS